MERVAPSVDLAGLRAVLETSLDAVIVSDADGMIVQWNDRATEIFGWSRLEAIGSAMDLLIVPPRFRQGHRSGMLRLARGGQARILNQRLEMTALHRDGREFPVEMAVTPVGEGKRRLYLGFLRDISDRINADRMLKLRATEAELTASLAALAADADTFDDALAETLRAVLELTGWQVGHAFIRPNANPVLASSGVWIEQQPGLADRIRAETDRSVFAIGMGMPGLILQRAEPLWIEHIEIDPAFARKGTGFASAFGFPLKSRGSVIAVLEFFSQEPCPPDPEVIRAVQTFGDQLGRVLERKRTEERQQLLTHELNHRVKNTLAVVQGIAMQTLTDGKPIAELRKTLADRLSAVAAAHNLLIAENWAKTSIMQIVQAAIAGCGGSTDRISVTGRDFDIRSATAVSIALAVHELCTNAYKYGALSNAEGSVAVTWRLDPGEVPVFCFEWIERGGPAVKKPERSGFGTRLLTRGLTHEMGGNVEFEFPPQGLEFRFRVPVHVPQDEQKEIDGRIPDDRGAAEI